MGSRLRAKLAALVTLLVLGTSAVACSSGSPSSQAKTDPSPDTHGPGTPLALGLKVQPGSHLVGTVFPSRNSDSRREVRTAVIGIDGDFARVVGSYLDATERLGLTFDHFTCGGPDWSCGGYATSSDGTEIALDTASPVPGAQGFPTTLNLEITNPTPGTPTTTMDPAWRRLIEHGPKVTPPTTVAPDDVLATSQLKTVRSAPIPRTGQRIAPQWMDPDVALHVEPGSRLLRAASPLQVGSYAWSAVARITGDPTAVFDAYLGQYPRHDRISRSTRTIDGKKVRFGSWSIAGGQTLDLVSVPDSDGTWLLLIRLVND